MLTSSEESIPNRLQLTLGQLAVCDKYKCKTSNSFNNNKVFTELKILSKEISLSTHIHTVTCTHEYIACTQFTANLDNINKQGRRKIAAYIDCTQFTANLDNKQGLEVVKYSSVLTGHSLQPT